MTSNFRLPRRIAASVVIVMLVAMTAAIAMGLSHPDPVSSGALGPDWQCTRLALVFTSCTRVARLKTASAEGGAKPSCRQQKTWRRAMGWLR